VVLGFCQPPKPNILHKRRFHPGYELPGIPALVLNTDRTKFLFVLHSIVTTDVPSERY
jgi:hypothetical protein